MYQALPLLFCYDGLTQFAFEGVVWRWIFVVVCARIFQL